MNNLQTQRLALIGLATTNRWHTITENRKTNRISFTDPSRFYRINVDIHSMNVSFIAHTEPSLIFWRRSLAELDQMMKEPHRVEQRKISGKRWREKRDARI